MVALKVIKQNYEEGKHKWKTSLKETRKVSILNTYFRYLISFKSPYNPRN